MALIGYFGAAAGRPAVVDATQKNPLGARAFDESGNEYIYLQGVGSMAKYDWVTFDEAHVTTRAVANAKGRVAVATAAVDATTKFGWFQIYGKATGKALTAFADNGNVYLTATAGSIDDAVVAGDAVIGAIGRSALDTPVTGTAYFEINYPMVMDITAL